VLKRLSRVEIRVGVFAGLCLAQLCLMQTSFAQGRMPGRGRTTGGRGALATPVDPNAPKGVYPTERGVVKSISGSQLFVEMDDEHEMKFRLTRKTKVYNQAKDDQGKTVAKEIKASALEIGETVDVDMQTAPDGSFEAVRISVVPPNADLPKAESPK
jgi:hypothetical protein